MGRSMLKPSGMDSLWGGPSLLGRLGLVLHVEYFVP